MDSLRDKIDNLIRDLDRNESERSGIIDDPFAQEGERISREQMAARSSKTDPSTKIRVHIPDETITDRISGRSKEAGSLPSKSAPIPPRFRDWNPDMEVARRIGVTIRYSSRSNEVRCPDLNISSRHVTGSFGYEGPRVRLTSHGPVSSSGLGGAFIREGSTSSGATGNISSSSSSTSGGEATSSASSAKSGKQIKN